MIDESSLGNAAADAVRFAAGTDVAIVNGGDIPDNALQPGMQDAQAVREAFGQDRTIAVCTLSYRQLRELLESGVSRITVDSETGELLKEQSAFGGFPQISGITMRFDATALPGERIMWIKIDGGTAIDLDSDDKYLTVAASEYLLSGGYEAPPTQDHMPLDMTLSQAMSAFIASGVSTDYTRVDRISMAGGRTNAIINYVPIGALIALAALLAVAGVFKQTHRRKMGQKNWDERYYDKNDRPLM